MGAVRPFNKGIIMTTKRTKKNEQTQLDPNFLATMTYLFKHSPNTFNEELIKSAQDIQKQLCMELGIDFETYSIKKPIFGNWTSEKTGKQYFLFTPYDVERKKHKRGQGFPYWFSIDDINQLIDNLDDFIEYINSNQ